MYQQHRAAVLSYLPPSNSATRWDFLYKSLFGGFAKIDGKLVEFQAGCFCFFLSLQMNLLLIYITSSSLKEGTLTSTSYKQNIAFLTCIRVPVFTVYLHHTICITLPALFIYFRQIAVSEQQLVDGQWNCQTWQMGALFQAANSWALLRTLHDVMCFFFFLELTVTRKRRQF